MHLQIHPPSVDTSNEGERNRQLLLISAAASLETALGGAIRLHCRMGRVFGQVLSFRFHYSGNRVNRPYASVQRGLADFRQDDDEPLTAVQISSFGRGV